MWAGAVSADIGDTSKITLSTVAIQSSISSGTGSIFEKQNCYYFPGQKCYIILTAAHVLATHRFEDPVRVRFIDVKYEAGHISDLNEKFQFNWVSGRIVYQAYNSDLASIEVPVTSAPSESLPLVGEMPPGKDAMTGCVQWDGSNLSEKLTTVALGYLPGELIPVEIKVTRLTSLTEDPIPNFPDIKPQSMNVFSHPGTSGAVVWGCLGQAPKFEVGPIGMLFRSELTRNYSWMVPWDTISKMKEKLLVVGDDTSNQDWLIRYSLDSTGKIILKYFTHKPTGTIISSNGSGTHSAPIGGDGKDSGGDGKDSGSLQKVEVQDYDPVEEGRKAFHLTSKPGELPSYTIDMKELLESMSRPRAGKSMFLAAPTRIEFGASVQLANGSTFVVQEFEGHIIEDAADLLKAIGQDPARLNSIHANKLLKAKEIRVTRDYEITGDGQIRLEINSDPQIKQSKFKVLKNDVGIKIMGTDDSLNAYVFCVPNKCIGSIGTTREYVELKTVNRNAFVTVLSGKDPFSWIRVTRQTKGFKIEIALKGQLPARLIKSIPGEQQQIYVLEVPYE